MEIEIGNVELGTIINMLQDGWKVKAFIYRALEWTVTRDGRADYAAARGNPMWVTRGGDPSLVSQTAWYQLIVKDGVIEMDMAPRRLGGPYFETGFNKIVFTREDG